jgi:hypothetical protein
VILGTFQENTEAKAKNMIKAVRKLYCNFSEDSCRERLGSIRGNIHLLECILVVTSKPLELNEVDRKFFNQVSKSSRGDIIATLAWQPWKTAWQLPATMKRQIYGATNRIEVGGPAPKGVPVYEKGPGDLEPAFFHQVPANLYKVLLEEHPLCGVFDCSPGQGILGIECVAKRTSIINPREDST